MCPERYCLRNTTFLSYEVFLNESLLLYLTQLSMALMHTHFLSLLINILKAMKSDLFVKPSQSCIRSICFGCYSNNVSESNVKVETEDGKLNILLLLKSITVFMKHNISNNHANC